MYVHNKKNNFYQTAGDDGVLGDTGDAAKDRPSVTGSALATHLPRWVSAAGFPPEAGRAAAPPHQGHDTIDNNYDPGPTTFTKPYHNNNKFLVVLNHVDGSRKCPGCDVEFENEAKPPHNMVIQHSERYSYPDPKNKELKKWSVTKERKMNYHARDTCILPRHPYFNASRLEMTDEVKKAMQPIHSKFLLDNFENVGM
jgi:hypothetical protein